MGHIAGLPANYPANLTDWPHNVTTSTPGPSLAETTVDDLFNAIALQEQPLPMWSWPMYSNLDYALTGMVNMAVAKDPPATHLELLQRDLFGPLGMNSTGINPDEDQAKRFAICSTDPSISVRGSFVFLVHPYSVANFLGLDGLGQPQSRTGPCRRNLHLSRRHGTHDPDASQHFEE